MTSEPKEHIYLDQVFTYFKAKPRLLGMLILASIFTNFMVSFDVNLYFFSSPYIISAISAPIIYLGISASSFTLGVIIFATVGGYLFTNYSIRKLLLLSIAIITIFSVLTGYVQNVWELVSARFLFGLGNGLLQGLITSLLGGLHPQKKGFLLSLKGITFSAGLLFGPYAESFFAPSYEVPFIITGIVGIVCISLVVLYLPEIYMRKTHESRLDMRRLFNSNTTRVFLSIFFFGIGLFGMLGYFSRFMLSELNYSNGQAALVSSMLGLGGIIMSLPTGHISDVWSRKLSLAAMFVIMAFSSIAIFGFHLGYLAMILITLLFGGAYNSLINIVSAAAQELGDSRDIGQLSGSAFSFYYAGGILGGPMFCLILNSSGFQAAGLITVTVFMVIGLLFTMSIREYSSRRGTSHVQKL